MKSIKVKLTGLRPLIMHNGDMVDHRNPYVVAIKRITAKGTKNMTPSDHDERDRLEWEAGLYWSDAENGFVLPCDNVEKCLKDGAKKARLGKKFDAAVLLSEAEVVIHHRRIGQNKEQIYADPAFTLRKRVDLGIIRVRPMVPTGWWLTCTVEFDESVVSKDQVIDACREAGSLVGLGDWRPKFGRFTVEVV